jgi:outer membrane receptor for ferrienterochelin and colicin
MYAVYGETEITPNFFPTAQARYEIEPDLIARAAISSTIARPGYQQVTAATTVDSGSGNITTGNPNLKPTTATGLDLSIEQYLPHAGIASLGFFGKNIKDYIVQNVQQTAGGPQNLGGNLGIVKLISFANASTSHLFGCREAAIWMSLAAGHGLSTPNSRVRICRTPPSNPRLLASAVACST